MPLKHFVTGQLVSQEMSQRVKELRQEMMPADRRLWQWLLDVFET
jgi:very-short-patch-repair endonuclease